MKPARLFRAALLLSLALPWSARADDAAPEALHVVRPVIHAEREKAELCLEFDRDLGLDGAAGRIAAALHLESDGKPVAVTRRGIVYGGNEICLPDLERRKNYRLLLESLPNKNGDKVSEAYSLSFKVPGRLPALSFVNQDVRDGVDRWRADPVLNSINGARVTVELFRLDDPAKMAEAWNQRAEAALAPSESLYFARHNGTSVWKKEIAPQAASDKNTATRLDLSAIGGAPFPPGLYLIAATLPEDTAAAADRADSDKTNPLTPVAAMWLLRSNLDLHALRDGNNVTALTETADIPNPAAHIRLLLLDHAQKILAEAQSDVDGKASLAPRGGGAATLIGISDKGDAAFADLGDPSAVPDAAAPPVTAELAADQKIYAPRETIAVALSLRDGRRRPQPLGGSSVQLLRPDGGFYDARPVTLDAGGAAALTFTAPVQGGVWRLVWQNEAGQKLAETPLRISADPAAPLLSLTPDRDALAAGGELNLVIHSRTAAGAAFPYAAGRVTLAWRKDDHPFAAWKDYRFDDGRDIAPAAAPAAYFVTGADGGARLHLHLTPPEGAPAFVRAEMRAVGDPPGDVLDSDAVTLPARPAGPVVGIQPRRANGNFPENSLAHFDLLALNADAKPSPADDLNYQIFEQGRSFEWFQQDGHWDYKPQQQKRRIGGGGLSFADDGRAAIEWPVASGAYQLVITDADGNLRARQDFNAGWNGAEADRAEAATLDLKASPGALQNGVAQKIGFVLPRAALVTATIADDHIREVIHAVYAAGAHDIAFTPAADWGDHVRLHIEARAVGGDAGRGDGFWAGELVLAPAADTTLKPLPKPAAAAAVFAGFARGLGETGRQTLAPGQNAAPGAGKTHAAKTDLVFIAPVPIGGLPLLLSDALGAHAFTTIDLARWLGDLRLWRETIGVSGLGSETEIQAAIKDGMDRLLRRQNQDGGFSPLPDGGASDLDATAAATLALAAAEGPLARPALDQAAGWLQRRLENTWFDEKERPARAEAYAALAGAGKLDTASLHYFSDTSADKALPATAMAALALAFASIDDRAAANFWLDKATTAKDAHDAPGLQPYLLANSMYKPADAEAALNGIMQRALDSRTDFASRDEALRVLRLVLDRAGTWRAGIGKDDKILHGVFVISLADKNPPAIRNISSDRSLYVSEAAFTVMPDAGRRRRIFTLDGQEAKGEPKRGAVYAVILEGTWNDGQETALWHDDPQPLLTPVTCALQTPDNQVFLGWLAGMAVNPVIACEKSPGGVSALLARAEGQAAWRAVYLAKAEGDDMHNTHGPKF